MRENYGEKTTTRTHGKEKNMWMMILIFALLCVFVTAFFVLLSESETFKEIDKKIARKIRGKENE